MELALGLFILSLIVPIFALIYFYTLKNRYIDKIIKSDNDGSTVASLVKANEDTYIIKRSGLYFDNFDFARNTIKLSDETYDGNSYYHIALASFISMFTLKNKYTELRCKLDKLVKYINVFAYILCLLGLFLNEYKIILVASFINIICLIYYGYVCKKNKIIYDNALKKLKSKKIINKDEEKEIIDIISKLSYYELICVVTNILDIGV